MWDEIIKLLQGYFLVLKFCFVSKDKLFLISFFVSYKPVLAAKLHLIFSLPDLFPLLKLQWDLLLPGQHSLAGVSQNPLGRVQQHRQCCIRILAAAP